MRTRPSLSTPPHPASGGAKLTQLAESGVAVQHEVRSAAEAAFRVEDGMVAALRDGSRCAKVVVFNATNRRGRQMKDTMIGVDLAKNVFQLHGSTMMGM